MDEVFDKPWTRKHDDPRFSLLDSVPRIVYPRNLAELREACANPGRDQQLHAAGSHWALSKAAVSDQTFIETHDPAENHQALGRTLTHELLQVLHQDMLDALGHDHSAERGFLVQMEAGKRIYQAYAELDEVADPTDQQTVAGFLANRYLNEAYLGPWAFETLGSAGGQTVVGAFSTGTHGGDFRLPPLADSVMAIHLVTDGGEQHWIEPVISEWGVQLTDDDKLREIYGADLDIVRDDQAFWAAVVSVGRFGAIYSVVLRVVHQYALRQQRELSTWATVKGEIKKHDSWLWAGSDPQGDECRFLQVAVCVTPYGLDSNAVGITRRWRKDPAGWPGRAERVGTRSDEFHPLIQAYRYSLAGLSHSFVENPEHPERSGDPDPLAQFCANGSFLVGVIDLVAAELEQFVEDHAVVVGSAIAYVAWTSGAGALGGLLALLGPLALIALALRELLTALGSDDRLGDVFDKVKRVLLDPHNPDPLSRAAGVFTWRMIAFLGFRSQQGEQDYTAISYAVLDNHDYLDQSCNVNVDSMEVFFDADGDELVAFVDALIAYEAAQEHQGLAFVGYASLRFTGPTRALIGPQRWARTCAIEVACLRDSDGGQQLVDYAVRLALDPNFGGVLHWGQHNDAGPYETYLAFGQPSLADPSYNDLDAWREVLQRFNSGGRDAFSNEFTRQTGLELL